MKSILVYGDSNTWGLNPINGERYNENIRYPRVVEKLLNERYRVIEEGLCGRTTIYSDYNRVGRPAIDFIDVLLESHNPDYLVIMLGTNDYKISNARSLDDLRSAMERLIIAIRRVYNNRIVLISPIYLDKNIKALDSDFDDLSYFLSINAKKVYKDLADKYELNFIDASLFSTFGSDGEHMTQSSHIRLANAIKDVILEL